MEKDSGNGCLLWIVAIVLAVEMMSSIVTSVNHRKRLERIENHLHISDK